MRVQITASLLVFASCQVYAQTDATIPLRGVFPQIANPIDVLIRAQQLRRLQLENQAIQQQNEAAAQQRAQQTVVAPRPLPPVSAPRRAPEGQMMTLGFVNGRLWNNSTADMKLSYIVGIAEAVALTGTDITHYLGRNLTPAEDSKIVDKFYEDPGNLPIPVSFALQITAMKANGATPEAVESFTSGVKRAIFDVQSKPTQ